MGSEFMKLKQKEVFSQNTIWIRLLGYFLLGVIVLSIFGSLAAKQNIYVNSTRFHQWISADSQHFPTAMQVYSWSKNQIDKNQKVVIVGGSSVMNGAGQSEIDTFSNRLQKKLGDDFAVINLALNGGGTFGQGSYIADKLREEGHEVIFISDFLPLNRPPYLNYDRYQYFFWDSKHNGLISRHLFLNQGLDGQRLSQSEILMWMNSKLHFLDLFNFISVRFIKLNHSPIYGDLSLRPLGRYADSGISIGPKDAYPFDDSDLKITQDIANQDWNLRDLKQSIAFYKTYFSKNSAKTLLIYCHNSPRYVDRLSLGERLKYLNDVREQLKQYELEGLNTLQPCLDFQEGDYIDRIHLSKFGAEKLAYQTELWIRKTYED
jgi:hypothetical protein